MTPNENQNLVRVLESAIIVSWEDLMPETQAGLVHIEYGFVSDGTLDYLKVWSSKTRGYWLLACEYWMSASNFHAAGIHFKNGHRSEGLTHILEPVMQHQTAFSLPADLGRHGLLQVPPPTQEESSVAAAFVNEALDRAGAVFDQPLVA